MKHKRTKACSITEETAQAVWIRDKGTCVICGKPGCPYCHYIARSQGGLGVVENIVTLCAKCHEKYDQTTERGKMRVQLREYLKSKYPYWNEKDLVYKNDWLGKAMNEIDLEEKVDEISRLVEKREEIYGTGWVTKDDLEKIRKGVKNEND